MNSVFWKLLDPKAWDPMETMPFGMVSIVYQRDELQMHASVLQIMMHILQTVEVCIFQWLFFHTNDCNWRI